MVCSTISREAETVELSRPLATECLLAVYWIYLLQHDQWLLVFSNFDIHVVLNNNENHRGSDTN